MKEDYVVPSDIKELEFEFFPNGHERAGIDRHVAFSIELLLTRYPKMTPAAKKTMRWVLPQLEQNLHVLTSYGRVK